MSYELPRCPKPFELPNVIRSTKVYTKHAKLTAICQKSCMLKFAKHLPHNWYKQKLSTRTRHSPHQLHKTARTKTMNPKTAQTENYESSVAFQEQRQHATSFQFSPMILHNVFSHLEIRALRGCFHFDLLATSSRPMKFENINLQI